MFNAQKPDPSELPSSGRLLKSTAIAAVIATVITVTVVMPAEYGIDPTGVGSITGLTEMGRIKMQLAEEAEADAAAGAAAGQTAPVAPPVETAPAQTPATTAPPADVPQATAARDEKVVTLAPDDGFEIKLVMEKGAKATFEWFTDGPGVNYDTHADGEGIKYHGYGKGTNTPRQQGELVAAFTGSHGWFWRNRSGKPVTITLRTSGEYTDIKQYD